MKPGRTFHPLFFGKVNFTEIELDIAKSKPTEGKERHHGKLNIEQGNDTASTYDYGLLYLQ
ncbi:MAG: hypothetical protein GY702_04675 [Desulfobulbaceae bacterium]|nr:hypothetical protein [Desulfobulbaceae bacterium]